MLGQRGTNFDRFIFAAQHRRTIALPKELAHTTRSLRIDSARAFYLEAMHGLLNESKCGTLTQVRVPSP